MIKKILKSLSSLKIQEKEQWITEIKYDQSFINSLSSQCFVKLNIDLCYSLLFLRPDKRPLVHSCIRSFLSSNSLTKLKSHQIFDLFELIGLSIDTKEYVEITYPLEKCAAPYSLELFLKKGFTDVTLKIGENEIPCHKIILVSSSDYFLRMFSINMKEKKFISY